MSWIYIVIIGYSMNAVALTIDKFLLTKSIPRPASYTLNVGVLTGLVGLALAPFGLAKLSLLNVIISLIAGMSFAFALFTMYTALKRDEASRIVPFIGSMNPVFIFILASIFLNEQLSQKELMAFFLIIFGGIIISWRIKSNGEIMRKNIADKFDHILHNKRKSLTIKIFSIATLSALLFAISYTLTKYMYEQTEFLNGFIWTRFGVFVGAIFIILLVNRKKEKKSKEQKLSKKAGAIFLMGQIFGGLSFFLVNYAFSLNSVTLVQAMQGFQYVVLFLLIIILSKKFPKILEEKLTPIIITQKIIAIIFIVTGLFILTI